jgi:Rod binding domain-containing protein
MNAVAGASFYKNASALMSVKTAQADTSGETKKTEKSDPKAAKRDADAWKAAEGFEEIFINSMLKQMRNTVFQSDDSLESSNAAQTYRSMLDEQFAKTGAQTHQFGLAKLIHDSIAGKSAVDKKIDGEMRQNIDQIGKCKVSDEKQ